MRKRWQKRRKPMMWCRRRKILAAGVPHRCSPLVAEARLATGRRIATAGAVPRAEGQGKRLIKERGQKNRGHGAVEEEQHMHPTSVIAIFDIGKTNKKLFLFDEQYRMVLEKTEQFEETTDDDGDALRKICPRSHAGYSNRWMR